MPVIVLEKPPVIWPGYPEGREAGAETRKNESMDFLRAVLDAVRENGSKLLYAEDFIYLDGVKALVELLAESQKADKGKVLYQFGVCAHQGSHAPAYDTPSLSGGGALFQKTCHPLGPCLFLKQVEGILRNGKPIRPAKVSAIAMQVLKHQPESSGEHFRVMQNVDDFARLTVVFEDETVAEALGHDLNITGIRNELSIITDFAKYDIRANPNNENEVFLPAAEPAGNILFREKLPTPIGTSFPRPNQFYSHGYVSEMSDAVDCALDPDRHPQSGPLMAWDTMAVLMAGYESAEKQGQFVDVSELIGSREFKENEMPDPAPVRPRAAEDVSRWALASSPAYPGYCQSLRFLKFSRFMSDTPFRYVIVGSGNISRTYLKAIERSPGLELVGTVSRSGRQIENAPAELPVFPSIGQG